MTEEIVFWPAHTFGTLSCLLLDWSQIMSQYRVIWNTLHGREEQRDWLTTEDSLMLNNCLFPFLPNPKGFWLFHCGHGERSQRIWIQHSWRKGIQNGFVRVEIGRRWTGNKEWKDEGKNSHSYRIASFCEKPAVALAQRWSMRVCTQTT